MTSRPCAHLPMSRSNETTVLLEISLQSTAAPAPVLTAPSNAACLPTGLACLPVSLTQRQGGGREREKNKKNTQKRTKKQSEFESGEKRRGNAPRVETSARTSAYATRLFIPRVISQPTRFYPPSPPLPPSFERVRQTRVPLGFARGEGWWIYSVVARKYTE